MAEEHYSLMDCPKRGRHKTVTTWNKSFTPIQTPEKLDKTLGVEQKILRRSPEKFKCYIEQ